MATAKITTNRINPKLLANWGFSVPRFELFSSSLFGEIVACVEVPSISFLDTGEARGPPNKYLSYTDTIQFDMLVPAFRCGTKPKAAQSSIHTQKIQKAA
jgi:hypothetical protein